MLVVGLTGRSGSGKSTVTRYYAARGFAVADGDEISRNVAEPGSVCLQQLAEAFGKEIVNPDGTLARKKLADIAFSSPQKTSLLVSITHPHIMQKIKAKAEKARMRGEHLFFLDGAVIVGGPAEDFCDTIVLVTAPAEEAKRRILQRDAITPQQAQARLDAQLSEEELRRKSGFEIKNDGSLQQLYCRADEVARHLLDGRLRENG